MPVHARIRVAVRGGSDGREIADGAEALKVVDEAEEQGGLRGGVREGVEVYGPRALL